MKTEYKMELMNFHFLLFLLFFLSHLLQGSSSKGVGAQDETWRTRKRNGNLSFPAEARTSVWRCQCMPVPVSACLCCQYMSLPVSALSACPYMLSDVSACQYMSVFVSTSVPVSAVYTCQYMSVPVSTCPCLSVLSVHVSILAHVSTCHCQLVLVVLPIPVSTCQCLSIHVSTCHYC